jgi:hypothetical protein
VAKQLICGTVMLSFLQWLIPQYIVLAPASPTNYNFGLWVRVCVCPSELKFIVYGYISKQVQYIVLTGTW